MYAAIILIIIFGSIVAIISVCEKEKTKRSLIKTEAALRQEELERGYKPGTYSSYSRNEDDNFDTSSYHMTREELEKGIRDLEERIKNLDTIRKNRKE